MQGREETNTRPKTLLVIVLLGLIVLFVSPLATSPSPLSLPYSVPEEPDLLPVLAPVDPFSEPAELVVAIVSDEEGYEVLRRQDEQYRLAHAELTVKWLRVEPGDADTEEKRLDLANQADILLIPNEWVRRLAVAGKLSPVDGAFVGEALSEQFDALISQLDWNGYHWGVPLEFDPYILVWNRNVLEAIKTEEDPLGLPLRLDQWQSLPQKLRDAGLVSQWLAIDRQEPQALLAWLGAVTGEREDVLFEAQEETWEQSGMEAALALLAQEQEGVAWESPEKDESFWPAFAAGRYAAAIVRESEAEGALKELPEASAAAIKLDFGSWSSEFVWPGGSSFVLSSGSANKDAALEWIAGITSEDNQWQNYVATGRLPVYRSLYEGGGSDGPDVSVSIAQRFPNQTTVSAEPGMAFRFGLLRSLWTGFMEGSVTLDEWKERWERSRGLFAEPESDD
ncbi:extracellular solute-binding protein [Cohnella fermenti]|uniref:Extracellular solute-binding protein n=1 Tax=Cohnella fermenti TaxID=2565925 RepID=A0A4S4BNR0_9BACL|nr:extracellular solute-binding protein [Cohnella fermenti]THF75614.1 extracellular solute-binding protein [Cohnella fermenti]